MGNDQGTIPFLAVDVGGLAFGNERCFLDGSPNAYLEGESGLRVLDEALGNAHGRRNNAFGDDAVRIDALGGCMTNPLGCVVVRDDWRWVPVKLRPGKVDDDRVKETGKVHGDPAIGNQLEC